MIGTFREFVKSQMFPRMLWEDEAAPASGSAPSAPGQPGKTNKHHFDGVQRQLGIDDKSFDAAIEGDSINLWKVPDYSARWGFIVNGPATASIKKTSDNSYQVTFHLKQKRLMSPKDFYMPKGNSKSLMYYDGPVEDQTVVMTQEELSDLMAAPFDNTGAAGMMPPMGGLGGM